MFIIVPISQFASEIAMPHTVVVGHAISLMGAYLFFLLSALAAFRANTQGVGILYDDYAEVKLKHVTHKILYSQIVKIDEKYLSFGGLFRSYHIRVEGKKKIVLRQGGGMRKSIHLYPLENFMMAMYKRLKREQWV